MRMKKLSPITITHRNLTRLQQDVVIGNGREVLKDTIRTDLSSILSDDESGELFDALESEVKDSFVIDGIFIESVDIIEQ